MTKSDNEVTRLKAAVELLDRGYGRPTSTTELTGAEGGPLIPPTPREELMTTFDLARRVAFTLSSGLKAEQELRTTPPPAIDVVPELQQEPEDTPMAKGEAK